MSRLFLCLPCSHESLPASAGPVWPVYLLSAVLAPPAAGCGWYAAPGSGPVASPCPLTSGRHQNSENIIEQQDRLRPDTQVTQLSHSHPHITQYILHCRKSNLDVSSVDHVNSWLRGNVACSFVQWRCLSCILLCVPGSGWICLWATSAEKWRRAPFPPLPAKYIFPMCCYVVYGKIFIYI